jgi:hypothetical protein
LEVDNMKTKLYATGPEGSLATRETDRPHKEPELVVSDAELAGRPFEVKSGFVSMPVWRIK